MASDIAGGGEWCFLLAPKAGTGELIFGRISNGKTIYASAGAESSSFGGVGDFYGDGRDGFITSIVNGATQTLYMNQVIGSTGYGGLPFSTISTQWSYFGAGDFLGNGQDGFLIENASGALVLGERGPDRQSEIYSQISTISTA